MPVHPHGTPWLQGDIDTLEKVQEKAVKMVSGLKGTTYKEKCNELGLQTLEDRRERQDMALVHKFLTEKKGNDMFRQMAANGRAGTRQAAGGHGLSVQYARTDPRKYSFAVRTVEKWNRLPDDVKSAPNGAIFRHKMGQL
jgi:ribonuclease P/MRP protein subunit RPP40